MSPFTQLQSALTHSHSYGNGIDRDFSPILNYIDEFDRHFSRQHRFVNCFIPRFDLEEDESNYYLYGDIPGATVEEINVEVHDERTLVVFGMTGRTGPEREGEGEGREGEEYGQVSSFPQERQQFVQEGAFPPPPTRPVVAHTHYEQYPTTAFSDSKPNSNQPSAPNNHKILLSERLLGSFTRTFAFPSAVDEKRVRASMENGVLSLVVPKKVVEEERKRGTKIPILKGGWWKAENGLHGENEPRQKTVERGGSVDMGNAVGFGGSAV